MNAKIFYMNDETKHVTVKVMDKSFDHVTGHGDTLTMLRPAEGRMFELDIPENSVIYVKKWAEMVLISYAFFPVHVQPAEDLLCWGVR